MKFSEGSIGGLSTRNIIGIVAKDLKSLGIHNPRNNEIFVANLTPQNGNLSQNDFRQLDPLCNDETLLKDTYVGDRSFDFKFWGTVALVLLFMLECIEIGFAQTLSVVVKLFNWPLANFILLAIFATYHFYMRWPFRPWHGAEHMACNALINGQYATIKDVSKQSRTAAHCGTNKIALMIFSGQIATLCAVLLPSSAILWQIMLIQFIEEYYDWMILSGGFFIVSDILVRPISKMLQFLFATSRPGKKHLDLAYAVLTDLVKKLKHQKSVAQLAIDIASSLIPKMEDEWQKLAIQDIIDEAKIGCPSRQEIDFLLSSLMEDNPALAMTKVSGVNSRLSERLKVLEKEIEALQEEARKIQEKAKNAQNDTSKH